MRLFTFKSAGWSGSALRQVIGNNYLVMLILKKKSQPSPSHKTVLTCLSWGHVSNKFL